MRALVERTDSFGDKSRFWIAGIDHKACWKQIDILQECSNECCEGNYYNILVWEEFGIYRSAFTGQILTNADII